MAPPAPDGCPAAAPRSGQQSGKDVRLCRPVSAAPSVPAPMAALSRRSAAPGDGPAGAPRTSLNHHQTPASITSPVAHDPLPRRAAEAVAGTPTATRGPSAPGTPASLDTLLSPHAPSLDLDSFASVHVSGDDVTSGAAGCALVHQALSGGRNSAQTVRADAVPAAQALRDVMLAACSGRKKQQFLAPLAQGGNGVLVPGQGEAQQCTHLRNGDHTEPAVQQGSAAGGFAATVTTSTGELASKPSTAAGLSVHSEGDRPGALGACAPEQSARHPPASPPWHPGTSTTVAAQQQSDEADQARTALPQLQHARARIGSVARRARGFKVESKQRPPLFGHHCVTRCAVHFPLSLKQSLSCACLMCMPVP